MKSTPISYWTSDTRTPLPLSGRYAGTHVFLVCGGPSLRSVDLTELQRPGIFTAAVNNATRLHRPDLFFYCDGSDRFIASIFHDPTIMKFVRAAKLTRKNKTLNCRGERIYDTQHGRFVDKPIDQMPNVVTFRVDESTTVKATGFFVGDAPQFGGVSTLIPAMRILTDLGCTTINLVGVDFDMKPSGTYAFDQDRPQSVANTNNRLYRTLNTYFAELRPMLEQRGISVRNCNAASKLTAFDTIELREAVDDAQHNNLGAISPAMESATNLYAYSADQKRRGDCPRPPADIVLVLGPYRSGTSMVAGMLSAMGGDTGNTFSGPANPNGYHEDRQLGDLLKRTVCPEPGLVPRGTYAWRREALAAFLRNRIATSDGRPLILKHPIIALVLPEMLDAFSPFNVRLVVCRRDVEVAIASMKKTRWAKWTADQMENAQRRIAAACDAVMADYTEVPTIDHEQAKSDPRQAAETLASLIEADEHDIQAAIKTVKPHV